jgi:hypothetical protein
LTVRRSNAIFQTRNKKEVSLSGELFLLRARKGYFFFIAAVCVGLELLPFKPHKRF